MNTENYKQIEQIAMNDVVTLQKKGSTYGSSWRARGGVGAFMMLARKWDRIENIAKSANYDVFAVAQKNTGEILDDIADLRAYLLLVESHVKSLNVADKPHNMQNQAFQGQRANAQGYMSPQLFASSSGASLLLTPVAQTEPCSQLGEPNKSYVNQG